LPTFLPPFTADCQLPTSRPIFQMINKVTKDNALDSFLEQAVLEHVEDDNEGTADSQLATNLDGIDSGDNNLYDVYFY
jgi:hypothetical protein